jgi:hypothetical protein
LKVGPILVANRWSALNRPYEIDVKVDSRGEYFDVAIGDSNVNFQLLQANRSERHLLLLSSDRQRFLCGHDERHWFVAGVGGRVSTVRAAKVSLIPDEIRERAKELPPDAINNRNNATFKRQGEWFFVPLETPIFPRVVFRNEPLQRHPGSKPHVCEEVCREGGELVYLVGGRALTAKEFEEKRHRKPKFGRGRIQTRTGNARVYARGYVRHDDHATIRLDQWHRVFLNAEPGSGSRFGLGRIAFLD